MTKQHIKKIVLTVTLAINVLFASAQGSLLIIGGGSESDAPEAWSTEPYSWAVEQSLNKRVAIISYSSASNWLPEYFVQHCGAISAKNFVISSNSVANSDDTYDSLMSYDVIFLKGGDQWNYYNTYKETRTQQAIEDKYTEGGVICGTSAGLAVMSEVVFTAKHGSVYPDECIENPNNQYVTLEDDFLNLFENYIFDSHFMDRGRGGRIMGFMANWMLNHDELISGIGVDENTCMAINNETATVYGTGAVSIYTPVSANPYSLDGDMLIIDSLKVTQLLHHCTFNFNTGVISGLEDFVSPISEGEFGNYIIFASGGDNLIDNSSMLNDFVNEEGHSDDPILIVTSSNQSNAESFRSHLINFGASDVSIFSAIASQVNDPSFEDAINEAKKIMFIDNEFYILEHFLELGGNGFLLDEKIRHDNMIIAFVGDNSRYAGATVVENYLIEDAANNSTLVFKKGLELLNTTLVIPNTYYDNNMFMNPAAAIPYSVVLDSLRFGIWLTSKNYLKYKPVEEIPTLMSFGEAPLMLLQNKGTKTGFATKTYSANYTIPRMIAGFDEMIISLLSDPVTYKLGNHIVHYGINENKKVNQNQIKIFPNPASNSFSVNGLRGNFQVRLIDLQGNILSHFFSTNSNDELSVLDLPDGVYIVEILKPDYNVNINKKLLVYH